MQLLILVRGFNSHTGAFRDNNVPGLLVRAVRVRRSPGLTQGFRGLTAWTTLTATCSGAMLVPNCIIHNGLDIIMRAFSLC